MREESPLAGDDTDQDLCQLDALELRELIRTRRASAEEVLSAFLERIERIDPHVNAICTLVPELAMADAKRADERLAHGRAAGALHGLPIAIKDLVETEGIRTTLGSRLYENNVPTRDALSVQRIKAAGAVVVGKTNVPEFGAGSHTFNEIFGATRNPYDLDRSAGGSSGGAAAALAARMLPCADGSDLGGSLRNPAAFCNVVGFRVSPGRVPGVPNDMPWQTLGAAGPMARTVADTALLLSVMAGPDPRDATSIEVPGERFLEPLKRDFRGTRVAWTPDLGHLPVDPRIVDVCQRALPVFEDLGCTLDAATPDLREAKEVFFTLRSCLYFAPALPEAYESLRGTVKDTVLWNTAQAYERSGADVGRALWKQGELFHRALAFMDEHDFLVLPSTQVPPFPVEWEWVREIDGAPLTTYLDWMEICWAITLLGFPAISVPCGFTPEGLPVGLQIVGSHHRDFEVLQIAYAFEQATRWGRQQPRIAAGEPRGGTHDVEGERGS